MVSASWSSVIGAHHNPGLIHIQNRPAATSVQRPPLYAGPVVRPDVTMDNEFRILVANLSLIS